MLVHMAKISETLARTSFPQHLNLHQAFKFLPLFKEKVYFPNSTGAQTHDVDKISTTRKHSENAYLRQWVIKGCL